MTIGLAAHAQSIASLADGKAARAEWEQWLAEQTGDFRVGVDYWASHRSLKSPPSCSGPQGQSMGAMTNGCLAAKERLAPIDKRRKEEPDYRLGFNIYAAPPTVPQSNPPSSLAPSSAPIPTISAPVETAKPSETVPPTHAIDGGSCKDDWHACKDNAELVNSYDKYFDVQAACETAATDQAKYGTPTWPGIFSGGPSFSHFKNGNDYVTTGVVVAIEPNAQFQNGFGAMAHSTVVCRYDIKAEKVISVDIVQN